MTATRARGRPGQPRSWSHALEIAALIARGVPQVQVARELDVDASLVRRRLRSMREVVGLPSATWVEVAAAFLNHAT